MLAEPCTNFLINRVLKISCLFLFFCIICVPISLVAQPKDAVMYVIGKIKNEQRRIDLFDTLVDNKVRFEKQELTDKVQQSLFFKVNDLILLIEKRENDYKTRLIKLESVLNILKRIERENIELTNQYESQINLANRCMIETELTRLLPAMLSNPVSALKILPFYSAKPETREFLLKVVKTSPTELLTHFKLISEKPYADTVLLELIKYAPGEVKAYLYSQNSVSSSIRKSKNTWMLAFVRIYNEVGMRSRAYSFLDDIHNSKITIPNADKLGNEPDQYLKKLIELIGRKQVAARFTIEKELQELCLKQIRDINDLHEEKDEVRFASTSNLSANEIYTLIVLGESEVYTSTFIGLYKRMESKITNPSFYVFLEEQNWLKFRTFIKMCAGYNTFNLFLAKLTPDEKSRLFRKFCEGLEDETGNLENAVTVADTYGSLKDEPTKKQLEKLITNYFYLVTGKGNFEASKLYELLLEIITNKNTTNRPNISMITSDQLFKSDTCYEQLMFYNDKDGDNSFKSFLAIYKKPEWVIEEFENYVKISPKKGRQVIIFANRPEKEAEGQGQIRDTFIYKNHWPEIVVHRGHSYYAWATIESLNPEARVVVLGSCGGYNNISKVLDISPASHIISSKQIGTMLVNNEVIYQMNETIRLGKDLDWAILWKSIDSKFKGNKEALEKFQDYIPPHHNLGALFIKTYRERI
ncbi:MAG: hypothetical protein ACKVQB_02620 [Bacteroidia bacterium]